MTLKKGDIVNAVIYRVENYGLWLKIEKYTAFILIPDIPNPPIHYLDKEFSVGEQVKVKIVRYIPEEDEYKATMII